MRILIDSADLTEIKQILKYNIISGITTNPSLVSRTFKDKGENSFMEFLAEFSKKPEEVVLDGDVTEEDRPYDEGVVQESRGADLRDLEISVQVTETEYSKIVDQGKRIFGIYDDAAHNFGKTAEYKISTNDKMQSGLEMKSCFKMPKNVVLKLPLTRDGIRACEYFARQDKKTNITLCFTSSQALICARAGATYVSVFLGRTEDNGFSSKELIENTKKVFDNYKFQTKILGASIRNLNHINICSVAGVDAITISPKLFYQMIDNELSIAGAKDFVHTWKESNLIL